MAHGDAMTQEPIMLFSGENEKSALGSMLFGRKSISQIMPIVSAEMFTGHHRLIFSAIKRLHDSGKAVDPTTLETELVRCGELEEIGGRAYLLRIAECVVTHHNGKFYAENVRDYWLLRQIEEIGADLQAKAREPKLQVSDAIASAQKKLAQVLASSCREGFALNEINPAIERDCLDSCFHSLNENSEYAGALVKGQLHIFAAREGVGKSIVMVSESLSLIEQGVSGCYYSLTDLNEQDIAKRLLRMKTGWSKRPDTENMALGYDDSWNSLADPFAEAQFRIFTGRQHGQTIDHVIDQIRARHAQSPIGFFVVDYLQAIKPNAEQKRISQFDRIAENARMLESLAVEIDAVGLMASQTTEKDGEFMCKGGRDIQEAANIVVFLKRDKHNSETIKAHVWKIRFGRSGWDFELHFNKSKLKLEDQGEA